MKKRLLFGVALVATALIQTPAEVASTGPLRFEITVAQGLISSPQNGRLFVFLSRTNLPEPRLQAGETGMNAAPVLARDVNGFAPGVTGVIDERAIAFPIEDLAHCAAGDYYVQALFDSNVDLKSVNAPGNLYSAVQKAHLDPALGGSVKIELTQKAPPEQLPAETDYVRFVKIQSDLLTKFHGRPIYLRAGVILPRDFDKETARKYPLRVEIGGYGARFTNVGRMMREGSGFRREWLADTAPRMVMVYLDGDGPFGDCYQVNSANNGPYGDAITQELIPYVEKKFRCIGEGYARVLSGGSTGGWVSLALQVFYPDFFNGTWSGFPDGVDFRAFQLINIYADDNAYVNSHGFERPSARDLNGDTKFTIRHECQMENALGLGDSWAMSGQQWGAWNAAYGPRGKDGRPVPLWDPKTGKINRDVIDHWKSYDLRSVMERDWKSLGPKLKGKITIWVGEADEYFLNNAVHMLDAFLSKADPPYGGKIIYGPGKGHGWMALTERQVMDEMAAAVERARH
ncbi:MAG TPA: alpha/beta hydrolase-fold protein [Blastocatellia bacterium]|nr:alpha/beta hydrolase-fold protein [Blastocatellia bacterium]